MHKSMEKSVSFLKGLVPIKAVRIPQQLAKDIVHPPCGAVAELLGEGAVYVGTRALRGMSPFVGLGGLMSIAVPLNAVNFFTYETSRRYFATKHKLSNRPWALGVCVGLTMEATRNAWFTPFMNWKKWKKSHSSTEKMKFSDMFSGTWENMFTVGPQLSAWLTGTEYSNRILSKWFGGVPPLSVPLHWHIVGSACAALAGASAGIPARAVFAFAAKKNAGKRLEAAKNAVKLGVTKFLPSFVPTAAARRGAYVFSKRTAYGWIHKYLK